MSVKRLLFATINSALPPWAKKEEKFEKREELAFQFRPFVFSTTPFHEFFLRPKRPERGCLNMQHCDDAYTVGWNYFWMSISNFFSSCLLTRFLKEFIPTYLPSYLKVISFEISYWHGRSSLVFCQIMVTNLKILSLLWYFKNEMWAPKA